MKASNAVTGEEAAARGFCRGSAGAWLSAWTPIISCAGADQQHAIGKRVIVCTIHYHSSKWFYHLERTRVAGQGSSPQRKDFRDQSVRLKDGRRGLSLLMFYLYNNFSQFLQFKLPLYFNKIQGAALL